MAHLLESVDIDIEVVVVVVVVLLEDGVWWTWVNMAHSPELADTVVVVVEARGWYTCVNMVHSPDSDDTVVVVAATVDCSSPDRNKAAEWGFAGTL
jgi:hypothetical protein